MNRRVLLATGAASAIILGVGGLRLSRDAPAVREPWQRAGDSLGDPRLDALAYAILAPSAHNRQPWLFRLDAEDTISVLPDLSRLLPQTDPLNRQIVVSFGAMLELLRMAAEAGGQAVTLEPFPEGEPQPVLDARPVARVRFSPGPVRRDPLMDAVLLRRTNRAAFNEQAVAPAALAAMLSEAPDRARVMAETDAVRAVCRESWSIESNLPRTHEESVALTRIGAREVAANPDGISLYGPTMEALSVAGLLDRDAMRTPGSRAHGDTFRFYDALIETGQTFVSLRSDTNTRADQLRAGRDWVRLHLAATRAGVAFHPLSQALQEFLEMRGPFERIHQLAGLEPPADPTAGRLQGVFRLGHAEAPRPSPRWPLMSRLVESPTAPAVGGAS